MSAAPAPALPAERPAAGAARLPAQHIGRFAPETAQGLPTDSGRSLPGTAAVTTRLVVDRAAHRAGLTEAGSDTADAFPRPLTDEGVQGGHDPHMGCGDTCLAVPGRRSLDWPVADPDGTPIAVVRRIRDAIDRRITDPLAGAPST
ncbi:hypothetical protein [Streptomyces thermolilacinus]|uniref:Uncharacterized protein n=1 Tax=Streptomyces thermolilacinus SPC6 TaxID=1306406 RepID=A0A1D3DMD7_9ACTN|nr:hypothetical protein [Streptomyces thermolilacinus]OEJ93484.1 hypothetical protein J116_002430 [Streptomyces thermolilacinus SPC6]